MKKEELEEWKKQYPAGTRIRLIHMSDEQAVPAGTLGTVDYIDDIGTIHMKWDNGQGLGLVSGEDQFEIVEKQLGYERAEVSPYSLKTKLNKASEKLYLNEISIHLFVCLKDKDFQYFKEHINEDYNFIRENRHILSLNENELPCLLVYGDAFEDGIIVQTDESNHVEYYSHIANVNDYMERIQQHETITENEDPQKIDVLIVEPNKEPYLASIDNNLKSFQNIVGGNFEFDPLSKTVALICHEEGKLINLPVNRVLEDDVIVGNFFIVGYEREDFCSLSDEDIEKYTDMFQQQQEDVELTFFCTYKNY